MGEQGRHGSVEESVRGGAETAAGQLGAAHRGPVAVDAPVLLPIDESLGLEAIEQALNRGVMRVAAVGVESVGQLTDGGVVATPELSENRQLGVGDLSSGPAHAHSSGVLPEINLRQVA